MIKGVRYLRDTMCIKRTLMKYNVLFESNIPIGRQDGQTGNKYKAITLALCSSSSGSRLFDVGPDRSRDQAINYPR